MSESKNFDRLRGHFHTRETAIAKPDCLDEYTVAALTDGTLDAEARSRALTHIAACALCRRAVASVAEALADGPITHEIEIVEGRRSRVGPVLRIAAPLAAAATVLLLLWSPADDRSSRHRGGGGPDATAPVPVAPVGTVAAAPVLVWTRVSGADAYRVTLFDAGGRVAYETRASDTLSALPDSVALVSGRPYLWKVEARVGFDRWITSALVEFSLAPHSP